MCFHVSSFLAKRTHCQTQSPLPSVITPIREQLEGVTGDRAAATVKANDRILKKMSKLKDKAFRTSREAAAFPLPHRLVSAKMIFTK
jgi:hypothetical protein